MSHSVNVDFVQNSLKKKSSSNIFAVVILFWNIREVKMHIVSDVTRKFSSRYLLARRKINASDLLLTSTFGVLRQIWREIARPVGNNVHLNLSIV